MSHNQSELDERKAQAEKVRPELEAIIKRYGYEVVNYVFNQIKERQKKLRELEAKKREIAELEREIA